MLHERNTLIALSAKEELSPKDSTRLEYLGNHLDDLGFAREYRDPLYQLFIEQMYEAREQPLDRIFGPDELQAYEETAKKVVEGLLKREKQDELDALAKELEAGE